MKAINSVKHKNILIQPVIDEFEIDEVNAQAHAVSLHDSTKKGIRFVGLQH